MTSMSRRGFLGSGAGGITLVGASAVGPLAGEWIHMLVLAIKADVPVATLRDTIYQFPTFAELVQAGVRELEV